MAKLPIERDADENEPTSTWRFYLTDYKTKIGSFSEQQPIDK